MVHKILLRTTLLLFAAFLPMALMAEELSVSGRVTDSAGVPIAGVCVTTEASGIFTITDGSGNFSLSVPAKEPHLLFQMTGMEDLRVRLDGERTNMEVRMTESQNFLDDVVAIGYGTISRSELSSSVSSVNSDQITQRPSAFNVTQALAGKVAGYMVHNTSGRPGGTNTVYIRGKGIFNGSSAPLYVVDGMVDVDIDMINPNDIESVDVLKDAAATAIYGARGANGVVLVSTKSGRNQDGTVTYSGSVGVSEYSRAYTELEKYYQKGLSHGHNLAFAKANERNTVYASLGYKSMGGIVPNSDANRLNAALNFTSKINDWLDVRFGADFSSRTENRGDLVFDDLAYKTAVENLVNQSSGSSGHLDILDGYDVNTMLDKASFRQKDQQVLLNGAGDVHLAKGLTLTVRGDYRTNFYVFGQSAPGGIAGATVADNGFANIANSDTQSWANENYLTFDKTFGNLKTVSVLGTSFSGVHHETSYGGTTDFSDNQYEYYRMQAGTVYDQATSGYDKRSMNSVFFRTNMALDSKFLFGVTLRYDSVSNYGDDARHGFFPSVSFGWIATDYLKLRASYGSVGNSNIAVNYGSITRGMEWEDSRQADLGFDLSLWNGKVNITADFYNNDIHNYYFPTLIPGTTGVSTEWKNLGLIRNQGVELDLNAHPVDNSEFKWDVDFIYSLNASKAVEIGSRINNSLSPIFTEEGGDLYTIGASGRVMPRHDFNLVNTFNWKGFSLLVDVMAKAGFWTYCDSWNTRYQAAEGIQRPWTGIYSDQYVYSGNYLRLRNISLSYDLKRDLLKNVNFFRGAVLGVSAENVFTSTGVPSIDPEDFVWDGKVGVAGGAYPRPMSISGTLKLTF